MCSGEEGIRREHSTSDVARAALKVLFQNNDFTSISECQNHIQDNVFENQIKFLNEILFLMTNIWGNELKEEIDTGVSTRMFDNWTI